jgi:tetratricopeptide (TPR) repeat protein
MLRYADAIKAYDRALAIDPTGCEALIARGDAWINIGDYEQALSDYDQAINLGDSRAYAGRGTAYYYLGMYDDALADLEFATQLPQNNSHSYCLLALTYFEFGRYQDILDAVSAATATGPECGNYKIYEVVSQSYYELGQYEEGISYITIIFDEKHTIFTLGYYYRGIMYDSLGKNQEAIQDLAFFIRMGQSVDDSYPEQIADAKARLAKLKP